MGQCDKKWARSNYSFYGDHKVLNCHVAEYSIPRLQLRNSKKHNWINTSLTYRMNSDTDLILSINIAKNEGQSF